MGELKRFSANIPLIYNKEDIHNYKEDSEFICGLTNNSEEAESILMPVLHNVCRVLSFQMNVQNCNKQGYQPRVQTDYKNIDWSQSVHEPYEEIMAESDEVDEYIDENGKKIQVVRFKSPRIVIKTAIHISMFTNLNEKEVIGLLHVSMDEKLDYMLEEYYVALGVEMITSKFYHLFTIVELIEQEYIGLSNSYHLFSKEEINQVMERIENSVEDLKQCYVKDAVPMLLEVCQRAIQYRLEGTVSYGERYL